MEAATRWVKFKVAMAGMFFNSIAAFVVLTIMTYATGKMPAVLAPFVAWAPQWAIPLIVGVIGSFGIWLATPPLVGWLLFTGLGTFIDGMAGPIGIIQMGHHLMGSGAAAGAAGAAAADPAILDIVANYAFFFYMLNVAVAGCNLLPFHPLDGSYIPVLLLDKFGGKHRQKIVNAYKLVTMFLFVALIVLCFYADIARLVAGKVLGQQ
jgi:Zn-dependent protease